MSEKGSEFQINEYLSLRLEDDRTNIYVAGKLFRQCKFLLLNIPIDKLSTLDELESIDEAAEKLDHSLEPRRDVKESMYKIPPEVEFWGHCSNLQVWYEYEYNTKLLHSNLAFPLVRELARGGDPQAKKVFKEEVAKRYNYGVESVRKYLRGKKYLQELSIEEFLSLIEEEKEREAIEQLRELYPRFERRDLGGLMLKINLDVKKGRIVKIDLRGLELRQIPKCVRNLTSLEYLNISYNLLDDLPEWIGELQKLKVLIIMENQFITLPKVIGEIKNLEELYAHGNQLENLPESIGKLYALKILELYQNKIDMFPDAIGNLPNLELLDLHKNNLRILPESVCNLINLKKITLDENQLTSLPESIGNLVNLEFLILGNNDLRVLPNSIKKLHKLKRLDISKNVLLKIPEFIYNLPNLEYLFIRDMCMSETQVMRAKVKYKDFINKDLKVFF